jgi:hypothetical protein
MPPRDRYERDPHFRALVDVLYHHIEAAHFTPTEIREAAILAQIRYEERRPRRHFLLLPDEQAVFDARKEIASDTHRRSNGQ